ncbi:MAG: T9SS type A sorting domain-containing protein, partial [Flavobacteriales bacterium]|nr:T9SS type A sorting domain-containing protein [Flavobacteriales bacterium]
LTRFELDGTIIGEWIMPSVGNQIGTSFTWCNDVAITAYLTDVFGAGGQGVFVESRINDGVYIINTVFGGTGDDIPLKIIEDSQGRIVFIGYSNSYGLNTFDGYLVRLPDHFIVVDYEVEIEENVNQVFVNTEEKDNIDLQVFPNPARKFITIKGLKSPTNFTITSANGALVQEGRTSGNLALDIPNGIYFLRLEDHAIVHRLIISNE